MKAKIFNAGNNVNQYNNKCVINEKQPQYNGNENEKQKAIS